jgi:acetyltransferase
MEEKPKERAPYPKEYERREKDKTGAELFFRPIRPDDEDRLKKFYESMSDASVALFSRGAGKESFTSQESLAERASIDYDRDMRLIAFDGEKIVGVAELLRYPASPNESEMSTMVLEEYQKRGIASLFTDGLLQYAKNVGLKKIKATTAPNNGPAIGHLKKLGFDVQMVDGEMEAELSIGEKE